MNTKLKGLLGLALSTLLAASAHAQLTNPSFETGDFTGWTLLRSVTARTFRTLPLPHDAYQPPLIEAGETTYEAVFSAINNPLGAPYSVPISNGQYYANLSTFQPTDETDPAKRWAGSAIRQTFQVPGNAAYLVFDYVIDTVEPISLTDSGAEYDDYLFVNVSRLGRNETTILSRNDLISVGAFNGSNPSLFWLAATSRRTLRVSLANFKNFSTTVTIGIADEGDSKNPTDLYLDNVRLEVATTNLTGRLTLQGWDASAAGKQITVRLYEPGNHQNIVQTNTVTLNPSGVYALTVNLPGTYDVGFQGDRYLQRIITNQNLNTNATVSASLVTGDINKDNTVDDFDLFELTSDFLSASTPGKQTDLTGDAFVDDFDLFLLTQNFLQQGDR